MLRLGEPLVLLAGGKSERAGAPKGLRAFQGRTWLEEQLVRFRAAGGTRAVVVLGFSPERYEAVLAKIGIPGLELEISRNPTPELGPFSSVRCGLLSLKDSPGAFIQPVDVPCPEPAVWSVLSRTGADPGVQAALPETSGRGGHPVWVSRELAQSLLRSAPTGRLDAELGALPSGAVARVAVSDPSVRLNLNTPADWSCFESRSSAALDAELGHDAGLLTLAEAGLGSLLHAVHLPGAGHLLSLNQTFLLSRSTLRLRSRSAGLRISAVAGLLKSLSPAGKKLTPMMAISLQGALFSAGTGVLGANRAGVCFGAALSSVWAFAQPLLLSYLIFGKRVFGVAQLLFDRTSELLSFPRSDLWTILAILLTTKAVLASILALLAVALPETLFLRYVSRLRAAALRPLARGDSSRQGHAMAAFGDLARPVFVFPLILTFAFVWFSESPHAALFHGLLRPVALGYLVFLVIRLYSLGSVAEMLERRGFVSTSRMLKHALTASVRSRSS